MYLADFSLNTVTLLALSLVIGILIDDAIVEIENIARHLQMAKSPKEAALEAADEIGLAVIATTLTIVAAFRPTAFMSGIPGLVFRQFGVTAAVAVLASLVVARLLTPMMAAYLMKARPVEAKDGRIMRAYMALVKTCLHHRKLTVLGICLFLGLSLSTIPLLRTGFLPPSDDAQTQVAIHAATWQHAPADGRNHAARGGYRLTPAGCHAGVLRRWERLIKLTCSNFCLDRRYGNRLARRRP